MTLLEKLQDFFNEASVRHPECKPVFDAAFESSQLRLHDLDYDAKHGHKPFQPTTVNIPADKSRDMWSVLIEAGRIVKDHQGPRF